MDNGRTVHPAVLFMLNYVSLSPSAFLSLSIPLSAYLCLCPLHLPLYLLKHPLALTIVEATSPQTQTHFLVLPSITCFFSYSALCPFLFFRAVVTVSVLFSFNLNTFQPCMNWAVINLLMFRHANVTELLLQKCMCIYMHEYPCVYMYFFP